MIFFSESYIYMLKWAHMVFIFFLYIIHFICGNQQNAIFARQSVFRNKSILQNNSKFKIRTTYSYIPMVVLMNILVTPNHWIRLEIWIYLFTRSIVQFLWKGWSFLGLNQQSKKPFWLGITMKIIKKVYHLKSTSKLHHNNTGKIITTYIHEIVFRYIVIVHTFVCEYLIQNLRSVSSQLW